LPTTRNWVFGPAVSFVVVLLWGCGSSTTSPDARPADTAPPAVDAAPDRAAPDVAGADRAGDGAADASDAACPAPGAPTTHAGGNLTTAETWTAVGSPHVVAGTIYIREGGKLTIEPCAEVLLAANVSINVAQPLSPNMGDLTAMGTAARPIRFVGMGGARWGSIHVITPGKVRLAHVTLEGGGAEMHLDGASLVAQGSLTTTPAAADLFVDHVTIKGSRGAGVALRAAARFAAGSTQLVVERSGDDTFPYPVRINPHAIDGLPDGRYTGNGTDEILIVDEGVNMSRGLHENATLRDRGVPYHVRTVDQTGLRVGASRMGAMPATLTIEPGVIMKFEREGALEIEYSAGPQPATGILRAIGTAAKPIVFTSAAATPAAGDWRGLFYGGAISPMNALDHVRVEYAGGDCSCGGPTCSAITDHDGALILSAPPPSAFITNSIFSFSLLHAIHRRYEYEGTTFDFRPTNTFTSNAGCPQTRPVVKGQTCPDPRPMCD
jgi:hypothetical protein